MNYFVLSEIIFFAVYAVEIYKIDAVSSSIHLLTALIYACLKLLYYVLYDKKISKSLSILILVLVGISGLLFYPMVLFFPLCLNQANPFKEGKSLIISFLSLFWLFALPADFIITFLSAFGFSAIIVYMQEESSIKSIKYEEKIENLKKSHMQMKEQVETYSQINENITYQSQLEERNKLSQALHDELGHTLSGNILRLEAVKLVADKDAEKSKNMLQEAIDNLREGMDSIRSILTASKPEISTVNIANLQLIIDKVRQQSDINIRLKYNSDINVINQSMWHAVIPNIKEALTNMMKYSSAENCEIEFTKLNKLYKISVKDDGLGCETIEKGLGMIGIEERMAMIDGKAIFDASNGFSVIMIFPI